MIYQIQTDRPGYALRQAQVTVCENAAGEVTILYKNRPLPYSIYHQPVRQAEIVDSKSLDRQLNPPAADDSARIFL